MAFRARPSGPPNRGRAGSLAPRLPRAAATRRAAEQGLGSLGAAGRSGGLRRPRRGRGRRHCCSPGAEQRRRRARRGEATGRAGGRLGSARACGAGPRTEEEAAPLAARCSPGGGPRADVPYRSVPAAPPGEAARVPAVLGVPSAPPPASPARAAWHQVRGRVRGEGTSPVASEAGAGPPATFSLTGPSARGVSSPRPAARDAAGLRRRSRAARHPSAVLLGHALLFTCW